MLRTLPRTRDSHLTYRVGSIALFTLLTIIAARVSIPMQPVPFTLQPLAVLFAGLVLGARDGGLSQIIYLALIALNVPVDANMLGTAALLGPTAGYLVGFAAAAFIVGWLVERVASVLPEGASMRVMVGASIVGVFVIYLVGALVLWARTGMGLSDVLQAGVTPFIVPDLAKAVIAAGLATGGRRLLMRQM